MDYCSGSCARGDDGDVGEIDPEADDEQFARAMAHLAELAVWARAEFIVQDDPAAVEKAQEAADIARSADDLVTMRAMRRLVERHGGGRWRPEDIAAITGRDAESVRRVLDEMVRRGFAAPPQDGP